MSLNEREPMSALSNSIHVDTTTGKRSYQMTDQGALATLTDVIGGTAGGYASYAAKASNAAAVAQATNTTSETIKAAEIALATAKTAQNFALGGTAALSLLQSGAEFDSRGRYTGNWSLEGARGDSALLNTVISAISAEAVGAMGLKQGTLPNNLIKSVISTGLHTTIEYQKMMAGQSNNYAAMATSDLSRAGELTGTVLSSFNLFDFNKEANSTDQTQRASDVVAGAGVFGRRDENGNLIFDSATGDDYKFGDGIKSTLAGYAAMLGFGKGGLWEMTSNWLNWSQFEQTAVLQGRIDRWLASLTIAQKVALLMSSYLPRNRGNEKLKPTAEDEERFKKKVYPYTNRVDTEKELWFLVPSPTYDGYEFFNADGSIYEINEIKHDTFIYGKRIGKWSIDVNKGEFKLDYPYRQYLLKCCFLKCGLITQHGCTIGCTASNRFPEIMYDFFGKLKSSKLKEWPMTQNEGDYTITSDYGDIEFTR